MIRSYRVRVERQTNQPHRMEWKEVTYDVQAHSAEDAVTQVSVYTEGRVLMVWPAVGHFIEVLEDESDG